MHEFLRALGFVLALGVTLMGGAACAPQIAARGLEMRTPDIEGDRFVTRDGLRLGLKEWRAETPHAVIVALHGMNDYSNAFAIPAPYWASVGITTYAYDQRGFGRSPNTGIWPGAETMRQDLGDFVDVARARHPGLPVFVLGESMGGAVVLSALASSRPPQATGFVLVAPAVWGWRALPFSYRATLWMAAHVLPGKSFTGSGLKIVPTDNIEVLRANGRDPLFIKNTRTDAIYGLVNLMDDALAASSRVERGPVLFLYGGRDQIIPKSATEAAVMALAGRAEIKRYDDGYHMLLRDLRAEPRWVDVANWIRAHEMGPMAVAE